MASTCPPPLFLPYKQKLVESDDPDLQGIGVDFETIERWVQQTWVCGSGGIAAQLQIPNIDSGNNINWSSFEFNCSGFSAGSSTLIVPKAGVYQIDLMLRYTTLAVYTFIETQLYFNSVFRLSVTAPFVLEGSLYTASSTISTLLNMAAGDSIQLSASGISGTIPAVHGFFGAAFVAPC